MSSLEITYNLSLLEMLVELSPIIRIYDNNLQPPQMTENDARILKETLEVVDRFSAILGKKYIKYLEYKLEETKE